MVYQTHYPGYDVMREAEAWDEHTREIVKRRLEPVKESFFGLEEIKLLQKIIVALIDDERPEIIDFMIGYIGSKLRAGIGESERKINSPPLSELIHLGLKAAESTARTDLNKNFPELTLDEIRNLLGRIERGELPASGPWQQVPQQEFFRKLLELTVESYYSHPTVWSEIGYGGPAYPRGYIRSELGLTDPWEPERNACEHSSSERSGSQHA